MKASTCATALEPLGAPKQLQAFLDSGRKLPIPPAVILRLFELGKDPDASPRDYAGVISSSSSLASKVLSTVNSSWFGVRHRVDKVVQAVNLLGVANVRVLAIAHCLAAVHSQAALPEEVLDNYWQVSLLKATAGRHIAQQLDGAPTDEALLIGLMQDMTLPVMHQIQPRLYDERLSVAPVSHQELCEIEREMFGMDHCQAAYRLAMKVGIPESLSEKLRDHHETLTGGALEVAIRFAGLLPHWMTHWAQADLTAATDIIQHDLGRPRGDLMTVLETVQGEYRALAAKIRPSGAERVDLPALVEQAAIELADSTTCLVGQVHSLMENACQIDRQLSEMSIETHQLQQRSQEDALTGVLNRHGLETIGAATLESLRAGGRSLSVWFVDVDDFKTINDQFGHDIGDRVLRHVATTMRQVLGDSAVVSRFGGDEFVAILGGLEEADVEALAREILDEVAVLPTRRGDGSDIRVSLSIGGLWRRQAPRISLDELIKMADTAMYSVKTEGKGDVVLNRG